METLQKETFNIGIAFEVLEDGASAPKERSKVTGHIIWDVKIDFTRNARWVLYATSRLTLKVYVRLISAMPISRHQLPTRTTSYAALS
jgi:hypothetical protein